MYPQLETLREKLLRGGVAPRHVSRYLRELSEHLEDLIASEEKAGHAGKAAEDLGLARLGNLEDLAKAMIAQKRFRSWTSRTPWAVFLLAPMFALFCAFILTALLLIFPSRTVIVDSTHAYSAVPNWYGSFVALIAGFNECVLPVLIGWAITTIAVKQRMRPVWPVCGLLFVAIVCGSQSYQITWVNPPNQFYNVAINLPLFQSAPSSAVLAAALRVLMNLVIMVTLYNIWRRRRTLVV